MTSINTDIASQSAQAMSEVLKLAIKQSADLTDKLIRMNVETAVTELKDEMVGQTIDLFV